MEGRDGRPFVSSGREIKGDGDHVSCSPPSFRSLPSAREVGQACGGLVCSPWSIWLSVWILEARNNGQHGAKRSVLHGLVGVLVNLIEKYSIVRRIPGRSLAFTAVITFAILSVGHCWREWRAGANLIQNERSIAVEYEALVRTIRNLPPLEPQAVVYFPFFPRYFDKDVLTSATQAALHRTDLTAEIVEHFPDSCRSCVQLAR